MDTLLGPLRVLLLTDPFTVTLANSGSLAVSALLVLGTASVLCLLAALLFGRKDLIWVE